MSPLASINGLTEAAAWAHDVASSLTGGNKVVLDGAAVMYSVVSEHTVQAVQLTPSPQ